MLETEKIKNVKYGSKSNICWVFLYVFCRKRNWIKLFIILYI